MVARILTLSIHEPRYSGILGEQNQSLCSLSTICNNQSHCILGWLVGWVGSTRTNTRESTQPGCNKHLHLIPYGPVISSHLFVQPRKTRLRQLRQIVFLFRHLFEANHQACQPAHCTAKVVELSYLGYPALTSASWLPIVVRIIYLPSIHPYGLPINKG